MMYVFIAVLFAGGISFGIWMYRWQYRTAETRVQRWAEQGHFTVLDRQDANPFGTGPKSGKAGNNKQVMYRVVVTDAQGARRSAEIKVGSPAFGVMSEDFVVEWDDTR